MARRTGVDLHAAAREWEARKPRPGAGPAVMVRWLSDKADLLTDLADADHATADIAAALRRQAADARRSAATLARSAGL